MADRYVPYEKRSKKEKKKTDQTKRLDWGQVRPATVTHKDGRDYDRQKTKQKLRKELETENG